MVNTRHMCVGSIILGTYGELRTHVCVSSIMLGTHGELRTHVCG